MHVLNRIVVALFSACLAVSSLVTVGLVTGGISVERLKVLEQLRVTLVKLPSLGTAAMVLWFVGAVVVLLFSLALFVMQFGRHRTDEGYLVREDELGTFTVHPNSIAAIASIVSRRIGGVLGVTCTTRQSPAGELEVKCRVLFRPGVPLDKTGNEYLEAARTEIEEMTGLKVGRFDLIAQYKPGRTGKEKRRFVA